MRTTTAARTNQARSAETPSTAAPVVIVGAPQERTPISNVLSSVAAAIERTAPIAVGTAHPVDYSIRPLMKNTLKSPSQG